VFVIVPDAQPSITVGVGGQCVHVPQEGVHNELNIFSCYTFDTLLNNVVAVLVFDALHHILAEFRDLMFREFVNQHC
jgi:hypothetical protein